MAINRIGILYHPMIGAASTLAGELEGLLTGRGVSVWVCSAWEGKTAKSRLDTTDLILTIGGDGTILRAVGVIVPGLVPIAGINLGRLGFMTELSASEAVDRLPALLAGEGWIDERAMLEAQFSGQVFHALNDVVVARGRLARAVYVETIVDDEPLAAYRADGVVVATATGSTGYSLAAGGPIMHPQSKEFVLLPVAPHLSLPYPLVLPPQATVELRVTTSHEATLSIDGHINLPLSSGDSVTVRQSPHKARFLRIHPRAFYGSLEQRLKGKRQVEQAGKG